MTTLEILDRLQGDALKDGELRKKLLATRLEDDFYELLMASLEAAEKAE